jgi:predicted PurR-regulated permease PerM
LITVFLGVLAVLAVLYTFYFAHALVLPIVVAILLNFVLSPVVRALRAIRIPEPVGAMLVLAGVVAVLVMAVYWLSGPAERMVQQAPATLRKIERSMSGLRQSVAQVTEATEQAQEVARVGAPESRQVTVVRDQSLASIILSRTTTLLFGMAVATILLYFLLASGDLFLRKTVKVLPRLEDKKRAVHVARETEAIISRYLFTVTAINMSLGAAVTVAMYLLGMPTPVLWGAMAALMNFVPYLGALVTASLVGLAAFAAFDETGRAVLAPMVFLTLTTIEGYFITPMILGRTFTLNPVAILMGMVLWGWIWGVPGTLLSVPILVVFKVICDRVDSLSAVGEFLGGDPRGTTTEHPC